ncbi:MAG: acyltransferase domain-containing protein, partial [bacterium]|nr:acyltransferase domain-containing protein [bacterium]
GIGGTNVHVILEEAPRSSEPGKTKDRKQTEDSPYELIVLSAKTPAVLDKITANHVRNLENNKNIELAEVAYTLQVGRKALPYRRIAVCTGIENAIARLSGQEPGKTADHHAKEEPPVIYMFPGQGSQYVGMGKQLYQTQPYFRQEMERCFEKLKAGKGSKIKKILYPGQEGSEPGTVEINKTEIAQPLIFIFEYALARQLMKWGIQPRAMIGHSIGEFTAATLAGVLTLEDALELVVLRGKIMQQMEPGDMLAVPLPQEEITPYITGKEISLAAVNTPDHSVVSGTTEAIKQLAAELEKKGINTRNLQTSHAFHSEMMDPVLKTFEEAVAKIEKNEPKIPYISNVTGRWITAEQVTEPGYWTRHIRQTVRYSDGLEELFNEKNALFVEIGPGNVLSTFVKKHKKKTAAHLTVNTVKHPKENVRDDEYILERIGRMWLYGKPLNQNALKAGKTVKRITLP